MHARALILLVLPSLVVAAGCSESDATLDVFVEARDEEGRWEMCRSSRGEADEDLQISCELAVQRLYSDACNAPSESSACAAIVPGETELRVGVLYTDATLDQAGRDLPEPTIRFIFGSTSIEPDAPIRSAGARRCEDDGSECPRAWSQPRVPFTNDRAATLEIRAGETVRPFELDLAAAELQIAALPEVSMLAAGVGEILVEVEAPALLDPPEVQIFSVFDGIEETSGALTLELSAVTATGRRLRGAVSIPVPDRPEATWTLRAANTSLSGTLEPSYRLVHALAPRAMLLDYDPEAPAGGQTRLAELDFDNPPQLPRRIVAEPDLSCRELWLAVATDTPPISGTLAVSTSAGILNPTTVPLSDGRGATRLTLPDTPESTTLILEISGDGLPARSLPWRHEPTRPTGAFLSGPPFVLVGPDGSSSAEVTGQLHFPSGVQPSTADIALVVSAQDDPVAKPCAPVVPASRIFCDAEDALGDGGNAGDCVLAPPDITPGLGGAFTVPLVGGLCFSGSVSISVHAEVTVEPEVPACIGEWPHDEGIAATPLDSFSVDYVL